MQNSIKRLISIMTLFYISFVSAAVDGNYLFSLESMIQSDINNISTPVKGMMIYNTTNNEINYYTGTTWIVLNPKSIYNADKQLSADRKVSLNSHNLGFISGNVGIGDETPDATLDVAGSLRLDGAYYDKDGDTGTVMQTLTSTVTGTDWTSSVSAPNISSNTIIISALTTSNISIVGSHFVPTSIVTVPGFNGTINSTNVLSPTEIQLNITTGTANTFDIVVSNSGILNTQWVGNGVSLLQVN